MEKTNETRQKLVEIGLRKHLKRHWLPEIADLMDDEKWAYDALNEYIKGIARIIGNVPRK